MIADHFGSTFLGKHWLNILSLIKAGDEKLDKGKSIAERKPVIHMKFEKGKLLAQIDDSGEVYVTSLNLPPFGKKTKSTLEEFIRNRKNILPDIYFSSISEEIYHELADSGINLIPQAGKNISSECTCGSKDICEHTVALIYSSVSEIEKNPALLFTLRGFELKNIFKDSNHNPGIIKPANLNSSFDSYKKLIPENKSQSEKIAGFHIEAVNILSFFRLLPEKPLFYSREDFRTLLLEKYKAYASYAAEYPVAENYTSKSLKDTEFYLVYFSGERDNGNAGDRNFEPIHNKDLVPAFMTTRNIQGIRVIKEEEVKIPFISDNSITLKNMKLKRTLFSDILKYFLSLPLELSTGNSSASWRFLNTASTIALLLVKNYAYVPEVRFLNNTDFIINYCPLISNKSIESTLQSLKELAPRNLIIREYDSAVYRENIHIHILQLFITYIINSFEVKYGRKHFFSDQKMYNAFFRGGIFHPEKYDEYQNGLQAALWLEKLSYINLDPRPVLVFRDIKEDEYSIHLYVKNNDSGNLIESAELFRNSESASTDYAARSRIIRQLHTASEYFPEVLDLINNQGTIPGKISAKEMFDFLKKTEPVLNLLGIETQIPEEMKITNAPQAVLTARLKNFSRVNTNLDIRNLIDFEWKIKLGDKLVPVDEFFKLTAQQEGIINIEGNYFVNDPAHNDFLLEQTNNRPHDRNSFGILRLLLSGEFKGNKISTESQVDYLLESLLRVEETVVPDDLNAELRDYQVKGFNWLYSKLKKGFGLCLADDMGLGKTLQVIAVLLKFKKEKINRLPVLIVCPTSLVANWYKELERFAPTLRVFIFHGSRRRFELSKQDIILTTYGIIRNETEKFRKYDWDLIILDEAQNIKNWESDQARSVKMLDSRLHLAMSGTPVENRLTELWSIFDFINKDYLGTYQYFKTNYAIPIEKYGDGDKLTKLRQITSPFILRRLKTDPDIINDLPDKIELDEFCYLTNEQIQLYNSTISEIFNKITHSTKNQRSGYILNLITSLKQICNHPALFTKEKNIDYRLSGKTEKAMDLVRGFIDRNEKVLIFTQYKEMGQILCMMLKYEFNIKPLFFHGALSVKKREMIVEQFQNSEDDKIMLLSIRAGGTGLNLTAAERVIHFDLWWNPAVENQATDRTFRIGQDKNVTIHRLISVDSFEEKIDKMLKQKKELADLAIISGEPSLHELSNKELKQLFKLDI